MNYNLNQIEILQSLDAILQTPGFNSFQLTPLEQSILSDAQNQSHHKRIQFVKSLQPPTPQILYKYYDSPLNKPTEELIHKAKSNLECILLNNELYLSSHTDFNDPFDAYPHYDLTNTTSREILDYCTKSIQTTHPKLKGGALKREIDKLVQSIKTHKEASLQNFVFAMRTINKNYGIYCLTTDPSNVLMWSHYAHNHQGICLEFDISEHLFLTFRLFEVSYKDNKREVLKPFQEFTTKDFEACLLKKAKSWEYEKEWRLIFSNKCHEKLRIPPTLIKKIIIGPKASPETIEYAHEINLKRKEHDLPQLSIKRGRLCDKEYKVTF